MFSLENRMIGPLSIAITFNSLIVVTLAKRPKKSTTRKQLYTEPPTPEYCTELAATLKQHNIENFIKILNKQYNALGPFPQNHEACYDTLDKMLFLCHILPRMYDSDVLTLNNTELIIKIKYNERACVSLQHIISKFLDDEKFHQLQLGRQITILALAFSSSGNSAISEWIAIFYDDGKIAKTQNQAPCLWDPNFRDLKYKDKPIVQYFSRNLE